MQLPLSRLVCGRHYRGSVLLVMALTVGFRPQLHAIATIVAAGACAALGLFSGLTAIVRH